MADILAITGPIYIVIAIGYLSTRFGMFARADMRVFGKFVIQLALPALLFNALSQRSVAEVLNPVYLTAYTAGSLLVAALGIAWARLVARKSLSGSAIVAMGMTCSNSGFIGYPLALQLLGPTAGVALALCMIVENVLMLPLLLALSDLDQNGAPAPGRWRRAVAQSFRGLLRNPMIIAIVAGLVFALLGLRLPEPAARVLGLFATSCGALALFVIGGTLVGLQVRGLRRDVAVIAIGKLLLHPLAVLLFLLVLPPLEPALRTAALVMAAVPMLGIYSILAQKSGNDDMAAAAQIGTTVASFVTLTALLWALRHSAGWGL